LPSDIDRFRFCQQLRCSREFFLGDSFEKVLEGRNVAHDQLPQVAKVAALLIAGQLALKRAQALAKAWSSGRQTGLKYRLELLET